MQLVRHGRWSQENSSPRELSVLEAYYWLNRYAFERVPDCKSGVRKVFFDVSTQMKWNSKDPKLLYKYSGFGKHKMPQLPDGTAIFKLFVADKETATKNFLFRTLTFVEDFLTTRVRRYPQEKFADRMFFGSELFQHTIHKVHREQRRRTAVE